VDLISKQGFPNYFGPQRFGHKAANIDKAQAMLSGRLRIKDRNKRSIYLSAARSFLFNLVLARRIEKKCWLKPLSGDQLINFDDPDAKEDMFYPVDVTDELDIKLAKGQIVVTGPLPGDGVNTVLADALILETQVLESQQSLSEGIANSRVKWHRRPLSVRPSNIQCKENVSGIELEFSLQPGAYATSLLRELLVLK
jgi:tRNA pseudouridine13 synthase